MEQSGQKDGDLVNQQSQENAANDAQEIGQKSQNAKQSKVSQKTSNEKHLTRDKEKVEPAGTLTLAADAEDSELVTIGCQE